MTTRQSRRDYWREYKRRRMLDPVLRAEKQAYDKARMTPDVRKRKNAQQREKWATNAAYRERRNQQRSERKRLQSLLPESQPKFQKWQKDYFDRHCDDPEFRARRDAHRVKRYYSTDDRKLIEALSLVRAAKRKMRKFAAGSE